MSYYCLLTINPPKSKHFIEVGAHYNLPFHPTLTDQIEIMGFPSIITEIYYIIEDVCAGGYATIRLKATDSFCAKKDKDTVIQFLKKIYNELKECVPDLVLNDWSFEL